MNIELVTIGTELLLGFTVDTNGAEIARALAAQGVRVVRRTSGGRSAPTPSGTRVRRGARAHRRRPHDRRARPHPRRHHQEGRRRAVRRAARVRRDGLGRPASSASPALGRTPVASNRSQAEVPRGATVLPQPLGHRARALARGRAGARRSCCPACRARCASCSSTRWCRGWPPAAAGSVIRSRVVRTTGIPESTLAERMGEIEREIAPLTLAYLPGLEGVDLRLSAWSLAAGRGRAHGSRAAAALLRARAGEHVYGEGETDLAALVLERARAHGRPARRRRSRAPAGCVGARLTEIPGQLGRLRGRRRLLRQRAQDRAARRAAGADRGARRGERAGGAGHGRGGARAPRRRPRRRGHRHRRARRRQRRPSRSARSGSPSRTGMPSSRAPDLGSPATGTRSGRARRRRRSTCCTDWPRTPRPGRTGDAPAAYALDGAPRLRSSSARPCRRLLAASDQVLPVTRPAPPHASPAPSAALAMPNSDRCDRFGVRLQGRRRTRRRPPAAAPELARSSSPSSSRAAAPWADR